jgi:hypothetical protein
MLDTCWAANPGAWGFGGGGVPYVLNWGIPSELLPAPGDEIGAVIAPPPGGWWTTE